MKSKKIRCWETKNPLYNKYHDEEWGVPVHDDRKLFEFLVLETFQAGLTWELILNRRESFREAFDNFEPIIVATYSDEKINELLNNPKIIRNRLKIESSINNAIRVLEIQKQDGSFNNFIWDFVGGKTINNKFVRLNDLPSKSKESVNMSQEMKKRGFKFIGPTICYAFMQAVGLVNDHLTNCFRKNEILI
jgi:DNA-3-methyladenine glycosylase I